MRNRSRRILDPHGEEQGNALRLEPRGPENEAYCRKIPPNNPFGCCWGGGGGGGASCTCCCGGRGTACRCAGGRFCAAGGGVGFACFSGSGCCALTTVVSGSLQPVSQTS